MTTVSPAPSTAATTSSARRAGCEPLVDPELGAGRLGDRGGGLAGAQQRARDDGVGPLDREPLAERARLVAAAGAERAQLVRVAGIRVGVADEDQAHGLEDRFRAMRSFRYVLADVFTDTPLAGNQLAVFTDARDLDELTMQALALELGLSETVFVLPPREGGTVRIRIFTPQNELLFAGHPCLGTAFVLGAPLQLGDDRARDRQRHRPGRARARPERTDRLRPDDAAGPDRRARTSARTSCSPRSASTASQLPIEVYDNGVRHAYVVLPSKEDVAALRPDMNALMELDLVGALAARRRRARAGRCACSRRSTASARTRPPARRRARSPATSPATSVVPWGEEIEIEQGTEIGRPSTLYARATGSGDTIESVEVGGSAVTVARGEFKVP